MFRIVSLAARLSLRSRQPAPSGLRKSFWRSVITSAVRGCSITRPGVGKLIASSSGIRRKSVDTDFRPEKGPSPQWSRAGKGSGAEAGFAGEPVEGLDPRRAEQLVRPPLGDPPGR